MLKIVRLMPIGLALGLTLAACGGGSDEAASQTTPTTAAVVTTPSTAPATTVTTTGAAAAAPAPAANVAAKADANSASQSEIQQALDAAGVPNPGSWAREVVEYRPYSTTDPTMAKLRQNLAKYNPGPGVVDKIVSALSL